MVSPKEDVIVLLRFYMDKYPGAVYWLTTHCRGGENHVYYALKGEFPDEFVDERTRAELCFGWIF